MNEKLLNRAVFQEMFSDELAGCYPLPSRDGSCGNVASFFVPRDKVTKCVEGMGCVRVYHEGQTAWAILPTDNQAVIPVDDADLSTL